MHEFIAYVHPIQAEESDLIQRSADHYLFMDQRRSVREFSDRAVPFEVIKHIIHAASSAPSGAHKQPWTFCVVASSEMKKRIRKGAERIGKSLFWKLHLTSL